MAKLPAAIRYNNPGAQYPGPSATRFGSTGYGVIGGGHKIAQFPTPVDGAAAQYDLLRRSYAGMPLGRLINKWSGGNDSGPYTKFVSERLGLNPNTVITDGMLRDPDFAVKLAKTKSQWETGGKFPLNDDQWKQAHAKAYGYGMDPRPQPGEPITPLGEPVSGPAPGSFRAAQEDAGVGAGAPGAPSALGSLVGDEKENPGFLAALLGTFGELKMPQQQQTQTQPQQPAVMPWAAASQTSGRPLLPPITPILRS